MADVLLVLRSRRNRRRRDARISWRLRDIEDPFEMSEQNFRDRFRLSKDAVKLLIREIRPFINVALNGYSIEMQVR